MKSIYLAVLCLLFCFSAQSQNSFCDTTGNIIIYSNYDGGTLRLSIDQNIPNLQVGIVSYEDDSVVIGGPFAGNVTKVVYAGYYNSGNIHCTPNVGVKGVYGVPSNIVTINFMPAATLPNSNGYNSIICNYSCNASSNQGGCNTPDQIVDYFYNQFPGSKLYYHHTQYGCWSGSYLVSGGGNCCILPITTGISGGTQLVEHLFYPNPAKNNLQVSLDADGGMNVIQLFSLQGEKIRELSFEAPNATIDLSGISSGIYMAVLQRGNQRKVQRIVIE